MSSFIYLDFNSNFKQVVIILVSSFSQQRRMSGGIFFHDVFHVVAEFSSLEDVCRLGQGNHFIEFYYLLTRLRII